MQRGKIILLSVGAAMAYGIIHDQITVRMSLEYFSMAHPALFPTQSPTLLALGWGVVATFWPSLIFGVLLARTSQSEGLPPMPIAALVRPVFLLLMTMALSATLAGFLGFELARRSVITTMLGWAEMIPEGRQYGFAAAWFAHSASYLVGFVGGTALILRIWNQRHRPKVLSLVPKQKAALVRALVLVTVLCLVVWRRFYR